MPSYFIQWSLTEPIQPLKQIKIYPKSVTCSSINKNRNLIGIGTYDGCTKIIDLKYNFVSFIKFIVHYK